MLLLSFRCKISLNKLTNNNRYLSIRNIGFKEFCTNIFEETFWTIRDIGFLFLEKDEFFELFI